MIDVSVIQVLTQIIGFLIVLWVLKKYAFGPFMDVLDKRSEEVRSEYENIENEKKSAKSLKTEYEDHLKHIEEEGRQKIQASVKEGESIAREIQDKARIQAKEIHEKAKRDANLEVEKARVTLKEDLVRMTLTATEKVLKKNLDDEAQHDLIARAIDELETA